VLRRLTLPVRPGEEGQRLDQFLQRRLSRFSREEVQRRISRGEVSRQGHPSKPSARVFAGEEIVLQFEAPEVPEDTQPLAPPRVLYEDERFLVVDKSPDLPVHPAGGFKNRSILTALQQARPGQYFAPSHRLDRETSGVLLFAKDPATDAALKKSFRERRCEKQYLALCAGSPATDEFSIDLALGPAGGDIRSRWAPLPVEQGGYPARTTARVAFRFQGYTRLVLHPETGRQHQLRVHLEAVGLPIVGDKLYGGDPALYLAFARARQMTDELRAALLIERQALHAHRLRIEHPGDGRWLEVESPWPADLLAFEATLSPA
jgi:23S rRNA pseudouridine1911/1915/1917 synthase